MNRKVIQITSALDSDGDAILHALCDDGTIWERCFIIGGGGLYWRQIEDINELLNVDTKEKAIAFAKDWNLIACPKLKAIAKDYGGIWYGSTGNIKLEESKDGKRWVHDRTAFKLNELLRQKKELENGIVKSWDESLVILEETSK